MYTLYVFFFVCFFFFFSVYKQVNIYLETFVYINMVSPSEALVMPAIWVTQVTGQNKSKRRLNRKEQMAIYLTISTSCSMSALRK